MPTISAELAVYLRQLAHARPAPATVLRGWGFVREADILDAITTRTDAELTPTMMPGTDAYTAQDFAQAARLIADAAEADDYHDAAALEAAARVLRAAQQRMT